MALQIRLVLAALLVVAWDDALTGSSQSAAPLSDAVQTVVVIQDYSDGLTSVRSANVDVRMRIGRDSDEPVLGVEYPVPTADPAGRDVQCLAKNTDWTAGHAIAFRIKPDHALTLSVSFFDRNRVVYTTRIELQGSVWQTVRIPFDDMRPNPYFQPPDAKKGAPLDVSNVSFIAFAPQDRSSGRLEIGTFVVAK